MKICFKNGGEYVPRLKKTKNLLREKPVLFFLIAIQSSSGRSKIVSNDRT